jgi:hypothetical protein
MSTSNPATFVAPTYTYATGETSGLISEAEVRAGNARLGDVTLKDVVLAKQRIDDSGVLAHIEKCRAADREGKHPGGPRPKVSDLHIEVAMYVLAREHSPLWVTAMRDLLWLRLTEDARKFLGLPHRMTKTDDEYENAKNWHNNVSNAFRRLVETMDPYAGEARRGLMNLEQREAQEAARSPERVAEMKERLDQYSNMWLHMTFMMQPPEIRARESVMDIAVDQTPIPAVSPRGRSKKSKAGKELLDMDVLETEAEWYAKNAAWRENPDGTRRTDKIWGWAGNLIVRVGHNPNIPINVPSIAMAFSLSRPNEKTAAETVKLARFIRDNGHTPGRITADKGYFALLRPETLHAPMRQLGFKPVTDYLDTELGLKKGKAGAIQVEGLHLCPSTPKHLVKASLDAMNHLIDTETYRLRIGERTRFALHDKELPDANGHVPKVCPAHGPGATVKCPLRPIHPKASKKRKPNVLKRDLLEKTPPICTQTSVSFDGTGGLKHEQALVYGSEEWSTTYQKDRNTNESYNAYVKDDGYEDLESSSRRRARGMAAQQVLTTMLVVSANIRKIAQFIENEAAELRAASRRKKEPLGRKRDREGKNKYMRKWPLRHLPDPKAPVVIIDDTEQAEELLRLADGSPPTL